MGNKPSQTIKDKLDQAPEQLDPAVSEQLRAARRHALDQLDKPAPFWQMKAGSKWGRFVLPVGGLATAASLALMVSVYLPNQTDELALPLDKDLIVLTEDLSLIEDLAFYDWMLDNELTESES